MKRHLSGLVTVALAFGILPTLASFEPLVPSALALDTVSKPMYSGIATVGFYNGQPHSVFTHVTFPGTCTSPVVLTQTMVDGILCGNGSGPTGCPNDPSTTSIDLRAYPANITSTGFDVFLSAMDGVWVGANSPAYPISWQATCGDNPMIPAIQDGKTISGVGNATFQNGHSNAIPGPISIPANCQNPSLVSQTQIESVLCGSTSGPGICPNDPSTTSQDLMSRVSRNDVSVSGNNGVWLGVNSPLFPVTYKAVCENNIGSTEKTYGGIINSGFYNGEAQTRPLHISLPPNCEDPTIVTQSLNDSVLCGNGSGPTVCPNDPSTTSVDLTSFAYASGDGYNLILSAMDGVWVGANSYAFPIAYHITCKAPAPSVPDQACSVPTSALRTLPGLSSVTVYEMTGGHHPATFTINDGRLVADINEGPGNADFSSDAAEYYDIFFSDEHGTANANGAYITVDAFRNNHLQDGATGNNVDSVMLHFADGHDVYASLVAHTDLGTGLSSSYQQSRGFAQKALGAPDGSPTYMGDQHSRLTLGMCGAFNSIPQCRDGIDNDGDGATDFPADFSCSSSEDNDETNTKSQCQDGIDNDQDGLIDYPQDSGCSSKQDNDESNVMTPALPACSDGLDNDGDGKVDFFDAGCYPNNVFNPALYNPNDTDESNAAALCRWTRVNSQWVRACR